MVCNTCGEKVKEGQEYCPNCGFKPTDKKHEVNPVNIKEEKSSSSSSLKEIKDGTFSFLWGILGYFIPILGLVLFILWKDSKPKDSKAAGIGALIRMILWFLVVIFVFVIRFFK